MTLVAFVGFLVWVVLRVPWMVIAKFSPVLMCVCSERRSVPVE